MQRHPVVPCPLDHALVVGRVRIGSDDHLGEVSLTEAERGLTGVDMMDSTIDRIEMHRRMHCWQMRAVLYVQFNRLVTQVGEEVGLPVPLQACWVYCIEQAL